MISPTIVEVNENREQVITSYLVVRLARASDAGIYTCSLDEGNYVAVNVHVHSGKCMKDSKLFQADMNKKIKKFFGKTL